MRLVSYNVHACVGTDDHYDVDRVANAIASHCPDVVCLQEIESNTAERITRKWSHAHADNQPELIAARCRLEHSRFLPTLEAAFADEPSRKLGEVLLPDSEASFGIAILSRFPIVDYQEMMFARAEPTDPNVFLMEHDEQPRGAQAVLLQVPCHDDSEAASKPRFVWVVNTHLSPKFWHHEHKRQTLEILTWVIDLRRVASEALEGRAALPASIVLAGDLNSPSWLPRGGYRLLRDKMSARDLWLEGSVAGSATSCSITSPSSAHSTRIPRFCNWRWWLGQRIDHIFGFDDDPQCCRASVIADDDRAVTASDHCAILAELVWTQPADPPILCGEVDAMTEDGISTQGLRSRRDC